MQSFKVCFNKNLSLFYVRGFVGEKNNRTVLVAQDMYHQIAWNS